MRKFKLQVQISADGYMAGPNGEMDWMTLPWTDDLNAYVGALWEPVDCIVLGRRLAEGFIPAWEAGPEGETQEGIDKMNNTPKVVISNTLTESPWKNAVVAGGDLTETTTRVGHRGREVVGACEGCGVMAGGRMSALSLPIDGRSAVEYRAFTSRTPLLSLATGQTLVTLTLPERLRARMCFARRLAEQAVAAVAAPDVAERAGHGVDVLLRVYAKCIDGGAEIANQRIGDALSN